MRGQFNCSRLVKYKCAGMSFRNCLNVAQKSWQFLQCVLSKPQCFTTLMTRFCNQERIQRATITRSFKQHLSKTNISSYMFSYHFPSPHCTTLCIPNIKVLWTLLLFAILQGYAGTHWFVCCMFNRWDCFFRGNHFRRPRRCRRQRLSTVNRCESAGLTDEPMN